MFNQLFTCFLSLSFFTISLGDIYSQEDFINKHLDFEKKDISSKEYYKLINNFNKNNSENLIQKRSDNTHKIDSVYRFEIGPDRSLKPVAKGSFIFDDDNLRQVFPSWDKVDSTWIPSSYSIYNFNKKGLLKKRTYNLWNGHEEGWSEDNAQILRFYEYDEDNRLIRFYAQDQQDISLNKFNNENLYHYDSLGQLTKIEIFFWRMEIIRKKSEVNLFISTTIGTY